MGLLGSVSLLSNTVDRLQYLEQLASDIDAELSWKYLDNTWEIKLGLPDGETYLWGSSFVVPPSLDTVITTVEFLLVWRYETLTTPYGDHTRVHNNNNIVCKNLRIVNCYVINNGYTTP
jgi:hypothetical protein